MNILFVITISLTLHFCKPSLMNYTHRRVVVRQKKVKVTIKISTPTPSLKASVKVSRRMEVVTNSFVIRSARYVLQRLVSVLQSTLDVLNHIGRMRRTSKFLPWVFELQKDKRRMHCLSS